MPRDNIEQVEGPRMSARPDNDAIASDRQDWPAILRDATVQVARADDLLQQSQYQTALPMYQAVLSLLPPPPDSNVCSPECVSRDTLFVACHVQSATCWFHLGQWPATYESAKAAVDYLGGLTIATVDHVDSRPTRWSYASGWAEWRVKGVLLMARALARQRQTKQAIAVLECARSMIRRHHLDDRVLLYEPACLATNDGAGVDDTHESPNVVLHQVPTALEVRLHEMRQKAAQSRLRLQSLLQLEISVDQSETDCGSEVTLPTLAETTSSQTVAYSEGSSTRICENKLRKQDYTAQTNVDDTEESSFHTVDESVAIRNTNTMENAICATEPHMMSPQLTERIQETREESEPTLQDYTTHSHASVNESSCSRATASQPQPCTTSSTEAGGASKPKSVDKDVLPPIVVSSSHLSSSPTSVASVWTSPSVSSLSPIQSPYCEPTLCDTTFSSTVVEITDSEREKLHAFVMPSKKTACESDQANRTWLALDKRQRRTSETKRTRMGKETCLSDHVTSKTTILKKIQQRTATSFNVLSKRSLNKGSGSSTTTVHCTDLVSTIDPTSFEKFELSSSIVSQEVKFNSKKVLRPEWFQSSSPASVVTGALLLGFSMLSTKTRK